MTLRVVALSMDLSLEHYIKSLLNYLSIIIVSFILLNFIFVLWKLYLWTLVAFLCDGLINELFGSLNKLLQKSIFGMLLTNAYSGFGSIVEARGQCG
jgi:hypothetical protein